MSGLLFLHSQSIVHRDVNPSNILLDMQGNARLADLGLAKQYKPSEKHVSSRRRVVGTRGFIDPISSKSGEYSPKTDAFAIGVTLAMLLVGQECEESMEAFDGGMRADPSSALQHVDRL